MQVALARQRQTPAGMLGQRMQHVVEEANPRVDANVLRLARLRRVPGAALEQPLVGVGREGAAVEVERQLDLGLVCVAGDGRPPRRG